MPIADLAYLTILIFAAAVLYSSVGHGGASAYIAAMALLGVAPDVMKPTALVLNILVAGIGTVRFSQAGYFSWRALWPFLAGSMPLAFIGGAITLPGGVYKAAVGIILLFAAVWLALPGVKSERPSRFPLMPIAPAIGVGGVIGFLAGLTGTGGGIFLSPLLIFSHWARMRETAGVCAPFILANSCAGLLGHLTSVQNLPVGIPVWAIAAVSGGLIGTELGRRRLGIPMLQRLLAVVLVIAGLKLILT